MAAITDLAAASAVNGTDNLVINQSGTDRKVTADKFAIVVAANTFTAAQTVVGAGIGQRQAATGNGAAIMSVGPARTANIALANGQSFTFTFDGDGCFFAVWFGFGALLFAPYNSATIAEISDPGNAIGAGYLNVTKSANSRVVSLANASGGTLNISILAFGSVTAYTNPA